MSGHSHTEEEVFIISGTQNALVKIDKNENLLETGITVNSDNDVTGIADLTITGNMTLGEGSTITVPTSISFTGDTGFGVTGTVSARVHIIKTSEQLRVGYDDAGYMSVTVSDGGSTEISTTTDNATGNLTLAPTGDIIVNPGGNDILPYVGCDNNIGSVAKKFLTIHAGELIVQNLVAQNSIATIGGRVLVGPTTRLTRTFSDSDTTIYVEHNEMASGDIAYLETNGNLEFISIDSAATDEGSDYSYTVTRDKDGSGANDWEIGDAVFNTGAANDGFIDMYSFSSVTKSGTTTGPTIVGYVRESATYNDIIENWAIGNLDGLYGYGSSTYGIGLGPYSEGDYLTIDGTNGIQFKNSSDAVVAQLSSGAWTLGSTSTEHVNITSTSVQFKDSTSVYADLTAGVLTLGLTSGGEYVLIDSTGIEIYGNATKNFEITSSGIGYFGDQSNEHVKVSTSGIQVKDGATVLATYGSSTTFYDTGGADRLVLGTSGITIGDSTEGEYFTIDSTNGIRGYGNAVLNLQITNAGLVYLGDQSNEHVKLSTSGLDIKDGATVLANYGATTTIGQVAASQCNVLISSGAMYFRNNTMNIISIANDGKGVITLLDGSDLHMYSGDDSAKLTFHPSTGSYNCELFAEDFDPGPPGGNIYLETHLQPDHSGSGATLLIGDTNYEWGQIIHFASTIKIVPTSAPTYFKFNSVGITVSNNKTADIADASNAIDDMYADDFNNVADLPMFDNYDDLEIIHGFKKSGIRDERTGFELIDDDSIPEDFLVKYKEDTYDEGGKLIGKKGDVARDPDGKPYVSLKVLGMLAIGGIDKLDNKYEQHLKEYHS